MEKVVNAKRRMGFDIKENLQIYTHKRGNTLIEGQSCGESNSLSRNSFEAAKQNGKVTTPSSRKGRVTVDEPSAICAMAQHIRSVQSSEQKPDDRLRWWPSGWNMFVSPPFGDLCAKLCLDYCLCACTLYLCKIWHFQGGCLWEGPPCGLVVFTNVREESTAFICVKKILHWRRRH